MRTFVDFIGYVAWPILIGYLVWRFEKEIKAALASVPTLASRVNKAGPLEFQSPQQSIDLKPENAPLAATPLQRDPLVVPFEAKVREALAASHIEKLPDYAERLTYGLAVALRDAINEGTARLIYGSQLAALKEMEASGPLTSIAIKSLYDQHVQRVQSAQAGEPASFLIWIAYLRDRLMVELDSEGRYKITDIGRNFLRFAHSIGLTEAKPF